MCSWLDFEMVYNSVLLQEKATKLVVSSILYVCCGAEFSPWLNCSPAITMEIAIEIFNPTNFSRNI